MLQFAATKLAGSLAAKLIVGSAVGLVLIKSRPSTMLRVAEDATIGAASRVTEGAAKLGNAVRIEYRARQLAAAKQAIVKQAAELRGLSPAQREALARDEAAIIERAEELSAKREGRSPEPKTQPRKGNRRASRAGRSATA